jgi:hypothetical protein
MKKASHYRHHAEECRLLARRMPPGEQRDRIIALALLWEQLAAQRDIANAGVRSEALPAQFNTPEQRDQLLVMAETWEE